MLRPIALILAAAVPALRPTEAPAQSFRIYTRVFNEAGGEAAGREPVIVSRSLTLFHAGEVYDYVEGAGELIVFEPAHHRFTIFSTKKRLAATVHFDEIRRLIKFDTQRAEEHLEKLEGKSDRESVQLARRLRFQLNPAFTERHDRARRRLTLSSEDLEYEVKLAGAELPDAAAAYRRFADWICRLNYVLHAGVLPPGPRLKLNERLEKGGWMPVEVTLRADVGVPLRLRAEHRIHWSLERRDRELIHQWRSMLTSSATKRVTFREYQDAILPGRK